LLITRFQFDGLANGLMSAIKPGLPLPFFIAGPTFAWITAFVSWLSACPGKVAVADQRVSPHFQQSWKDEMAGSERAVSRFRHEPAYGVDASRCRLTFVKHSKCLTPGNRNRNRTLYVRVNINAGDKNGSRNFAMVAWRADPDHHFARFGLALKC
jgi:hypothetical protein